MDISKHMQTLRGLRADKAFNCRTDISLQMSKYTALTDANTADPIDNDYRFISRIANGYFGQLTNGCGDTACREVLCYTGKCNISHGPVRRYTPRSARAIALILVGAPNPTKHLCSHYQLHGEVHGTDDENGQKPRDPSSFIQLLCDTSAVKRLFSRNSPDAEGIDLHASTQEALGSFRCVLDRLEVVKQPPLLPSAETNPSFVPNDEAAETLALLLRVAAEDLVKPLFGENRGDIECDLRGLEILLNHHPLYCEVRHLAIKEEDWYLPLLDDFHHSGIVRVYAAVCGTIANRSRLNDVASKLYSSTVSAEEPIQSAITRLLFTGQRSGSLALHLQAVCLKLAFIESWDHCAIIMRGTEACGALEMLKAIRQLTQDRNEHIEEDNWIMSVVTAQLEDIAIAESFLAHEGTLPTKSVHILHFPFLFSKPQLSKYFRMVNHSRMRATHTTTATVERLGERFIGDPPDQLGGLALKRFYDLHQEYLLLSVSRNNVLDDTLCQLWQRKRGELLKPLRVRLEEVGGLEIGQDLGGVQIEFFNLVMQAALEEGAGLFVTDKRSGLSYFRPGSLQPLHVFEELGILVALSLYNGIPIPLNFPTALYRHLLGLDCDQLKHIQDLWPSEAKSCKEILDSDISEWGLGYAYNLEANGIRLNVTRASVESLDEQPPEARMIVRTENLSSTDPTPIPSASQNLFWDNGCGKQYSSIAWPGWQFLGENQEDIPPLLNEDKAEYVRQYLRWLTYLSVKPQIHRFLKGFSHVIHAHTISMFTPDTFKSLVEGTITIDLASLRTAATYEGFVFDDTYIESFWKIVASWPEERQKALIRFVTAAERLPIGGAGDLTFKIQRSDIGAEQGFLPTSSTCFGTLYLPVYASEGELARKLETAVELGEYGFGTS